MTLEVQDEPVVTLNLELARFVRSLHLLKSRVVGPADAAGARERAAHVLLFPLLNHGPLRQNELAAQTHTDPSTISRHVALLIEQGLVRRTPDERDGRASLLAMTERGESVVLAMRREREGVLRTATGHWDDADVATLAALLNRLSHDLDASMTAPEKDR